MKQSKPLETWLNYKSHPNSEGAIILKKKVIMNASDHLLVLAVVVVVACIAAKADNTPTYFILGTLGNGKTELAIEPCSATGAYEWNVWLIAALVPAGSIALVITSFCCCLYYLKTGKIPFTCCLGKLSLGCCSPKRRVPLDMEAQVADVDIEFQAADIESEGVESTYIASAKSFYGDSEMSTFADAFEVESVRSAFADSVRAEMIRRVTDSS